MFQISTSDLQDKILGGWSGKSYGAMMGEPMEFHAQGAIYEGSLDIHPDAPKIWLHSEDDLYTNMAFLEILRDKGLQATQDDFADVFRKSDFMLWHANGQARQNLLAGIAPGLSGHPYYNPHADDIDFQIECDFIGIISPGLSVAALEMADKVGHLMNYGDGYYAGAFLATLYTYAYLETDMVVMIKKALKAIPAASQYAQIIQDILAWYDEEPENWRSTWEKVEAKWNRDLCPWAQSDPDPIDPFGDITGCFNIQGHFNGAYILIGLLYGQGDYMKAIQICTRCGQDTDSNVANCGGIMGIMSGFKALPQTVKDELESYMDRDYNFTTLSINSASALSYELAIENILQNGGSMTGEEISIATQDVEVTGECEISFPNVSFADIFTLLPTRSPEVTWHGNWAHPTDPKLSDRAKYAFLQSDTAGNYMEVSFSGNCVYVEGNLDERFGILDAYVDGELMQSRDMYIRKEWNGHRQATAVWIPNLDDGQHVLRVEVTGRKRAEAIGTAIQLGRVVSYYGQVPLPNSIVAREAH
ncbi:MAG: ADP-ribosylglycohydrolase family protein [Chloroflexota bacterium]